MLVEPGRHGGGARGARACSGGAYGRRVVVVAGKGNNGADGRVAAAGLARRGRRRRPCSTPPTAPAALPPCDLVIDAAYGTGFRGAYDAPRPPPGAAVLAVDIPSGVDGDTGRRARAPVRADATVTFAALKPGLLLGEGPASPAWCEVADIGSASPCPGRSSSRTSTSPWLPPGAARRQQVDRAVRGGGRLARHGRRGDPVHPRRLAGRRRDGPPGRPGGDPAAAWPTEAVRMHLPPDGLGARSWRRRRKCRRW